MRYETEIRAYDVLDQIWIAARVWQMSDADPGRSEVLVSVGISTAGEGESDPRVWLRDTLVALVETL